MVPVGMVPVGVGQVPPEGLGGLGSVSPPPVQQQAYNLFLGKSFNLLGLLPHPWVGDVSRELLGTERALQCP